MRVGQSLSLHGIQGIRVRPRVQDSIVFGAACNLPMCQGLIK